MKYTIAAAFLLVLVAGRRVQPQGVTTASSLEEAEQKQEQEQEQELEQEQEQEQANNEEGLFAEKEESDGSSIEEAENDEEEGEATSWELTSSLLQTEADGDDGEDAKDVTNDNRSYVTGSLLEEAKEANELEWGSTLHSWAQHYYNAGRSVTADALSSGGYSISMCSSPHPAQVFHSSRNAVDAEAFVKKKWNQGYSLAGWKINDAQGHTIKMSKNVGINSGIWRRRGSAKSIEQAIKRAWATNRRILDITGHSQGYTFVGGKSSEMSGAQSYRYTSSWSGMSRWIKKKWARNYYITAMTKRGSTYFVVMTKNSRFKHQRYAWAKNDHATVREINKGYKDNHRITYLFDSRDQPHSNRFFVVMSKVSGSKLFANKNARCNVQFKLPK